MVIPQHDIMILPVFQSPLNNVKELKKRSKLLLVQSLTNCNRNCRGRPSGQNRLIAPLLFTLHVSFPLKRASNLKELTPNTHFYMALYFSFSHFIVGFTFTRPDFQFEIDHDNGTINTDYAMR